MAIRYPTPQEEIQRELGSLTVYLLERLNRMGELCHTHFDHFKLHSRPDYVAEVWHLALFGEITINRVGVDPTVSKINFQFLLDDSWLYGFDHAAYVRSMWYSMYRAYRCKKNSA